MLEEKIQRIQTLLRGMSCDYLIIANTGHQIADDLLYWLMLEELEFCIMLIPAAGKPVLHTTPFEVAGLRHKRDAIEIVPARSMNDIITSIPIVSSVAYRPSALPVSLYQALASHTLHPLTSEEQLTAKKLPKEISRMRQAAKLTDILFKDIIDHWHEFFTEADAANFLLARMGERGVEPSFPPIIASGAHAAHPHHRPSYDRLQPGFCIIDMGIRFKGYCSDMTRTIYIGSPTKEEIERYTTVLSAQERTIDLIKPGTAVRELDEHCRTRMGAVLNEQFVHTLGHGLGTQVHEWPSVSSKHDIILNQDMVITIEPGVYQENTYGIRIEDDVLITEDGCDVLTESPKQLRSIPLA